MITFSESYTKTYLPYSITNGKWTYQDILEYDIVPSQEEIEQEITQKFNDWVAYVETPIN